VLKPCLALALAIPVFLSPCLGAEENAEWKPETEQAALTILRSRENERANSSGLMSSIFAAASTTNLAQRNDRAFTSIAKIRSATSWSFARSVMPP
jgi:hypothetical protein